MTDQLIGYRVESGIAWIELVHPPANTYSYAMMRQLDEVILRARMDAEVHVLVLRGAGDRFFCAGADIAELQDADPRYKYYFCLHANETLSRLEQTPKLVIAALNGHTVGGGLEVALAADLRIARRGAGKIGLPEVQLGLLPGTGGTQRLSRVLGRSRALELMITGRTFEFDEALTLGLVHQLFEPQEFDRAVVEFASRFVPPAKASRAVGLIKRAVTSGSESGFHEGLALERELQQQLFLGDDAREGLEAYLAKREPRFSGR